MFEDRELVKKIRYSLKAGRTPAEISTTLQKQGYKLEYIHALFEMANRPKRFGILTVFFMMLCVVIIFGAYVLLVSQGEKYSLKNPLEDFRINYNSLYSIGGEVLDSVIKDDSQANSKENLTEISIDDIEITPEFISYILGEVADGKLHKSLLNLENPIINFRVDNQTFSSEFADKIETSEGLNANADIEFTTDKETVLRAIESDTPKEVIKQSFSDGKTSMSLIASQTELYSKGYLAIYNEFNS